MLKIYGCGNIETDCVNKILAQSKKLEYLLVNFCNKINKIDSVSFANEITKNAQTVQFYLFVAILFIMMLKT